MQWKRKAENIFIFPFILLGRLIALIKPLKGRYRVFYFFPFYHTGGAEKIHLQIVQGNGGNDCIIFFTRKSQQEQYLQAFRDTGCRIADISGWTDNKWLYFLNLTCRGIISGYINRQGASTVVFNGQCNFAYKISPWISKKIRQVELIHSFNSFSYIRTPFLPFIHDTIMISRKRIQDHLDFYKRISVPENYNGRINYIPNAINLPQHVAVKNPGDLVVLFVGRGGIEKRLHLVTGIAASLHKQNSPVHFEILGDVADVVNSTDFPFIRFHGNLPDSAAISEIYNRAHILILTSSTEGFPLVVMEAMAHGCAVMATPVGDIPLHVADGINGYLFSNPEDEALIIKEGIAHIQVLQADRNLLGKISAANINYAKHNFDITLFNKAYQSFLKPLTA